jgi:hypothetical protein
MVVCVVDLLEYPRSKYLAYLSDTRMCISDSLGRLGSWLSDEHVLLFCAFFGCILARACCIQHIESSSPYFAPTGSVE